MQSFSKDGSIAVFCSQNNILKFWNTHLGSLEHEYQDAKYQLSCLEFCKLEKIGSNSKSPNKKKISIHVQDEFLAIGTKEGTIVIYNYTKRLASIELQHSHRSCVFDLCWKSPTRLISIGKDKKLILWNITSGEKLHTLDTKGGRGVCSIGQCNYAVAGIGITYMKYKLSTKETKEFKLADNKSHIRQLTPILFKDDAKARYVLSAAENDRFLYAWSTLSEQTDAIASCQVEDIIRGFCYSPTSESTLALAIWTKRGNLKYFVQQLNGSSNQKKAVRAMGTLLIRSSSDKSRTLHIIGATFLSSTVVLIIYGNQGLPQFERINIKDLKGNLQYVRKDPEIFEKQKTSMVKVMTPHVPDDTTYITSTQFSAAPEEAKPKHSSRKRKKSENISELPMEERLDALAITQSITGLPKGTPLDNCVHRLIQALHSKDSVLLNSILLKGEENIEVISSTVRKLPVSCIVPFLHYLQEVIAGKGLKNVSLINWIKAVFEHHMSLLSSLPNKEELMRPFYTICNSRLTAMSTVSQLHSRIHLLLTHVKNRQDLHKEDNTHEALLVYKDGDSSDDEDLALGMSGMPSESEDTWDYLSDEERPDDDDIEMINGCSDDDSVVQVGRKRPHDDPMEDQDIFECNEDN